ncbi:MAG: protein-disulfide reductase DsbD domain-containing protein [Alphaproteobacteria bacterium]
MPEQHKIVRETCQAVRRQLTRRASEWVASIWVEAEHAAAFGRCVSLTVLLLSVSTFASPELLAGSAEKGSGNSQSANHVEVSARRAGNAILITLRIDEGYHVNANPASAEYLIATSIAFEGLAPERIAYPTAIRLEPAFADQPIAVYEGTVTIVAIFSPGALDQRRELSLTLTAQVCTEQICLPPDDIIAKASW